MSVAMALARYKHHSSRGHTTARTRVEVEDELYDVPWHQNTTSGLVAVSLVGSRAAVA